MTIFDAIRYPISDPPTEEEIANLPPELFHRWATVVFFPVDRIPTTVARWYRNLLFYQTSSYDIRLLQRMIAEYNPNE